MINSYKINLTNKLQRATGCKDELLALCASTTAHVSILFTCPSPSGLVRTDCSIQIPFIPEFAEDEPNRKLLVKLRGPDILVYALKHSDHLANQNVHLLTAVATAIWKLSPNIEAQDRFRHLNVTHLFINHLKESTEEVS